MKKEIVHLLKDGFTRQEVFYVLSGKYNEISKEEIANKIKLIPTLEEKKKTSLFLVLFLVLLGFSGIVKLFIGNIYITEEINFGWVLIALSLLNLTTAYGIITYETRIFWLNMGVFAIELIVAYPYVIQASQTFYMIITILFQLAMIGTSIYLFKKLTGLFKEVKKNGKNEIVFLK